MKKLLHAFTLSSLLSGLGSAELVIYEPFDYPTTGQENGDDSYFGDGDQSGALGLSGAWNSLVNNVEMEVRDLPMTFTDEGGNELPVAGLSIRRTDRSGYTTHSIAVDPAATSALTRDHSTMWMSFLYVDEGFSGPDSSVMLASEPLNLANNHSLATNGYGVGILIGESAPAASARVESGYYLDSITTNRLQSDLNPNDNENVVFLLAAKINWNPDGTPDEIFVFNITDLTTEPDESEAIISDVFDMPLTAQQSLDTLNIGETQVDGFDEIRFGTTFADVVGAGSVGAPLRVISLTAMGDGVWEIELSGTAEGTYQIEAAPNLDFESATLVEGLVAGAAGTVGGPNDTTLTLDEDGRGVVQLSLGEAPRRFLRALTTP